MTTWTPQQSQAIHTTGKNITVSASAGSGKTTILVERILTRMLHDRIPVDRMLAMTFTEAAASEMKKRLFAALTKAKEQAPAAEQSFIEEQMVLLQRAQISTIHSFCLSIIQENYALIGFSLKRLQSIIGDDQAAALQRQAMRRTLSQYQHHEAFPQLKQYCSHQPQDHEVLEQQILAMADALAGLSDVSAMQTLLADIYQARSFAQLPALIRDAYFRHLEDYCFYIEETLQQMELSYIGDKDSKIAVKRLALEAMKEACEQQAYTTFCLHFESYVTKIPATCKDSTYYTALRSQLTDLDNYFTTILFDEHTLCKDMQEQYPLIQLLVDMALHYRAEYALLKEEAEVMDFEDMEAKALELLTIHDHEIAKRYQERFIDILVDEYQDSSYHQDTLIRLIQNKDNVFRVGDVKQSIYRFRGAVPSLLKGYIGSAEQFDEVIHLQHNYRSNSQIIHFVNQLFQVMMRLPRLECLFETQDVAHVGTSHQMTDQPSISLHVLQTDLLKLSDQDDDRNTEEKTAAYIAGWILEDKLDKTKRWSDYVILVRGHSRKKSLKRAFERAGIPNFIDNKEGFYNSAVIETMRAYLKVLQNPLDDIAFVSVCMSFYGLTDQDMAWLKLQKTSGSYFTAAKQSTDQRIRNVTKNIEELQAEPILSQVLLHIYRLNEFYETKTTAQERTNLDLLYEKACAFEQEGSSTIQQFIDFTDELVDSKSSEALSINLDEDVVRVMTIHQSKGLQFDTVVYWGKEKASNQASTKFQFHPQLGVGMEFMKLPMRLHRPTMMELLLSHEDRKAEVSEEIRILYVALTRAKNHLFMITSAKSAQYEMLASFPLTSYQLIRTMGFGHWLINQAVHSPLVSVTVVNSLDAITALPRQQVKQQILPKWQIPQQIESTIAPSSHTMRLQAWNADTTQAAVGSLTHAMIQRMDHTLQYSEEMLRNLAYNLHAELADQVPYPALLALQSHSLYHSFQSMTVYKELAFSYLNNQEQLISGYMDFAAYHGTDIYIVDFKTDRHVTVESLANSYQDQITHYVSAMKLQYPDHQIRAYLYSLWLNTFIEIRN